MVTVALISGFGQVRVFEVEDAAQVTVQASPFAKSAFCLLPNNETEPTELLTIELLPGNSDTGVSRDWKSVDL